MSNQQMKKPGTGMHGHGHGKMMMGEKAKDFKGTMKKLFDYLGNYKIGIFFVMLFAVGSTIFNIVGPKILGKATTEIFTGLVSKVSGGTGIDFGKIGEILVFLMCLYACSAGFSLLQGYIMTGVSQKLTYRLRKEISEKINRLPLHYFDTKTHGEVLSRVTNDVDTLSQSLNQSATQIITSVTTIIGVLVMMLSISPLMTLVALLILPVSLGLISTIVKRSQGHFRNQQEYLGHVNGQVEEVYSGHNIVRAFNKEQDVIREFEEMNDVLYQSAWKSQFFSGMIFEKQYILTQIVEVEVHYRTETRTDSEGNDYDVEVPYNYYICKVKLENFDLSHVPVYIMDEETLSLYAVYMATLGNREDLFPGSGYVDKYTKPPTTYDIPPSALEDETFAALITEAEKYIGYPYVWGGSNPNTSFDCSGFVSWALTQSGVCNTGRLGAQGLYNISTPVSSANAKPGDLIFFVGTYDTPGVSHVGIYVGGGKMLHCGDPIQYADINTSYWQSHFYAFGRPPYN